MKVENCGNRDNCIVTCLVLNSTGLSLIINKIVRPTNFRSTKRTDFLQIWERAIRIPKALLNFEDLEKANTPLTTFLVGAFKTS